MFEMSSEIYILTTSAFLTSILSGVTGMGGGIILLSVMMNVLPAVTIVPLHGVVQLVSNGSRLSMHFRHIKWSIGLPIVIGGVIGVACASPFTKDIQGLEGFRLYLAIFILLLTWKPKFKNGIRIPGKFYLVGFFSHALSILFGAIGPFLAPFFINAGLTRHQIISTKALAQYSGHFLKILVYLYLGFEFSKYAIFLGAMSIAVIAGNYVGKLLLNKVSDKLFLILFRTVITVLCSRIIYLHFY